MNFYGRMARSLAVFAGGTCKGSAMDTMVSYGLRRGLKYKFSSESQTQKPTKTFPTFSQLECKQLVSQANSLRQTILQHLKLYSQMKLQKYWNLALTDSQHGYYRQQNVFSKQGDFTTSPEISPLFGQMIAVWLVYFLTKAGVFDEKSQTVAKKFRIVQFGPGRGFLMRDVVKSLHEMKVDNHFDLAFVEVSEYNRKCQQDSIFQQFKKYDTFFRFEFENQNKDVECFKNQSQFRDVDLKWYPNFELLLKQDYDNMKQGKDLPVTVFLMNEFFDALPTTVMQYTEAGWRQRVFVKSNNPELPLQLTTSKHQVAEKFRPTVKNPQIGQTIEVSHESLITMDAMAKLLLHTKGVIMNIDYGADNGYSNSIRAIKQHKFIPEPFWWQVPGKCDLSAYVNFAALADFAKVNPGIQAFQVIPQGYFLQAMGINPRIEILQKNMKQEERQKLQSEYHRLVHPQQMGANFKVQCITLKQYGQLYPWIEDKEGVY